MKEKGSRSEDSVSQQEDVPRHALDGEVFVHAADGGALGVLHDLVVGSIGDRAPGRDRGQARAAPAPEQAVDAVSV